MARSTLSRLLPVRSLTVLCLLAACGVGAACSGPGTGNDFPEAMADAGTEFSPEFELEQSSVVAEREVTRLDGLLPVIEGRWVVLGEAAPKSGIGGIRMDSSREAEVIVTSRTASAKTVSAKLPGIQQAELVLSGVPAQCSGHLGEVRVMHRMGSSYFSYDEGTAKLSDAAYAKQAWEQSEGFGLLVAELETSPDCAGARFVSIEGAQTPDVLERYQPAPDDAQSYQLAQQAFIGVKQLERYKATRSYYHEFLGDTSSTLPDGVEDAWETYAGAQPELVFYGDDEHQFVGWTLHAGEGCGDFYGNLSVLYQVVSEPSGVQLRLVEVNEASSLPDRIVSYSDHVELWDADGVRAPNAEIPRIPLYIPTFECPC
ncbi:MAG: hypothetical protein R3B07_10690 [Polyangiaceae bacterium]